MKDKLVDWGRIKRRAGPNENWPGRPVYCFGSLAIRSQTKEDCEWLKKLRAEALQEGFDYKVFKGDIYLVKRKRV
jgi:hypothetical protein